MGKLIDPDEIIVEALPPRGITSLSKLVRAGVHDAGKGGIAAL